MNVADSVRHWAMHDPGRPAIHFEARTMDYAELDACAARLASGMLQLGVRAGDRVALLLPNTPAFAIGYLAIQRLGAIAVSIGTMSAAPEVAAVLADCSPRLLVIDTSMLDRVPSQAGLRVATVSSLALRECWDDALISTSPASPGAPVLMPENAPAAILYTSGTTGYPKGATLSQRNIITNARAAARCYRAGAGDSLLLFLPLFHCFGQNAIMNAAFAAGAALVLQRRFSADEVVQVLRAGRVTHLFGVPSVYVRLLEWGIRAQDLAHVRYAFSAAAPLAPELAKRWRETTGLVLHEGYGLTETSPFATYNHLTSPRGGSVGTAIDGAQIRVVGTDGRALGPGEIGEIEICGSNVMLGYWNRSADTHAVLRDGWFRSGDLGQIDCDGYLYVVDRIKEMIIVSGYNVYPSEVENVLLQHPQVSEPAVFGVPHGVTGEAVHAAIVRKHSGGLDLQELRTFCKARLATYKVPVAIEFVDALPKGPSGKILRRVLREHATQLRADADARAVLLR